MHVIPLGTNGFFPSFGRATACYAIPLQETLIILDAGSGLFRLAEPEGKELLKGAKDVHLYLSHYHLDHTFGFYAADKFFRSQKVTVFGPKGNKVFSEFITSENFFLDLSQKHRNFSFKTIEEGEYELDDYKVSVLAQRHRDLVSLSYRFNFGLSYVTDGEPTKGVAKFVIGSKLLLHEHGKGGNKKDNLEKQVQEGHVTSIGAAMIAKEAKVGKLVLMHHNPFADNEQLRMQLKLAKSILPETYLAEDFREINFV